MVRSMYSGVAGMRANQNRMDVIGNNIANANTYGFKSGRATFRDIYYQQFRGASQGTVTRGGINPSNIGYGSQLASIDLMMDSASMTSTGFALDCAITGEGFFQVMDPDGNIFYTKAGMLDIDPATGAVIDSNGNFVLGTSATNGKLDSTQPGQNKIIIELDSVPASQASVTKEVGGRTLTITSQYQNKDANISFTFSKSSEMPDGMKVRIVREGTSSVYNVQLNANEYFEDMTQLQTEINNAITQNYGGDHPGGQYTFDIVPNPWDEAKAAYETANPGETFPGLTGAELVDTPTENYEGGSIDIGNGVNFPKGFGIVNSELGLTFGTHANGALDFSTFTMTLDDGSDNVEPLGEPGVIIEMGDYKGKITLDRLAASVSGGTVMLKGNSGDPTDYIVVKYPGLESVLITEDAAKNVGTGNPAGTAVKWKDVNYYLNPSLFNANAANLQTDANKTFTFGDANDDTKAAATATPMHATRKCGWGKSTFTLEGGCEFHTQDISNITGISIGADGVISGTTENGLTVLGRIDLATFANAKGLDQVGSSYFAESANSGPVKLAIAGESGTGAIKNSSLEMSNVDLAQEFSDMIVTQRGFQASSRMITVSDTMLEELTNLKR